MLPDGRLLAETWDPSTIRLLDPASGATTLISASYTGAGPNPIVWADQSTGYVVGAYGAATVFREDGGPKWTWNSGYGCCNVYGLKNLALDQTGRRLLAAYGYQFFMVPLDSGPPPTYAYGDQTFGASTIVATGDVAYQGADRNGWVTKWRIAGSQPVFQWEFPLGGSSFYNSSDGAIASDASFVVTESGDHASAFWNVADDHQRAWRASALDWIAADGHAAWTGRRPHQ